MCLCGKCEKLCAAVVLVLGILFLLRDDQAPDLSEHLVDNIYLGTHPELLQKLFKDDKSERDLRVFAGYASWSAGQLAAELSHGDWHLLSIDAQIVFSSQVESLWETLIDRKDPKGILVHNRSGCAKDLLSIFGISRENWILSSVDSFYRSGS